MCLSDRSKSLLLFFVLLLTGCTKSDPRQMFSDEGVRYAAEYYYTLFAKGEAKQFVEGMSDADFFPEDYKEQMQDVIAHASKELARKGGIIRVETLSDTISTSDSTAYVYLDLVFADSIHEQVSLPMIYQRGLWRMK